MDINKEFIKQIYNSIKEKNEAVYTERLNNTGISDLSKKSEFKLYKNLSREDKEILLKIIKEIEIDAISNMLGIIDGHVTIEDCDIEPRLFLNQNDTDGDLQELFLELDENNELQ